MNRSTPGLPAHHQLPESTQTHWVGDAIQPSHPLSSTSPPALNLSQHQGLLYLYTFITPSLQISENGISVEWNNMPKITQLINGLARNWTQVVYF